MATSVFSSLFSLLDFISINDIASGLREPGYAVSRGMESSTATLISGLADRSSDPNSMGQIFRLISQAPSEVNVSNVVSAALGSGGVSEATSSLLDSGKKLLSLAFGVDQPSILDAIGRSTGLRSSSVTSLMSMTAPLLLIALERIVRSDHMTQVQLGNLLVTENAGIQSLLPAGLQKQFERIPPTAPTLLDAGARPFSISTVPEPRPSLPAWFWIIPALLLVPFLFWLFNQQHVRQVSRVGQADAERARLGAAGLGDFVVRRLPGNVDLNVPKRGVEANLLAFIQDASRNVEEITWFDFDRLLFDTDSAHLRPESQEQLRNIAAILRAYPNVHIRVGGYTDDKGDAQNNLKLSQDRANGVVAGLIALGIAPDRLEAHGYGDQYPVADNSTEEGRARNRRISMRATQK